MRKKDWPWVQCFKRKKKADRKRDRRDAGRIVEHPLFSRTITVIDVVWRMGVELGDKKAWSRKNGLTSYIGYKRWYLDVCPRIQSLILMGVVGLGVQRLCTLPKPDLGFLDQCLYLIVIVWICMSGTLQNSLPMAAKNVTAWLLTSDEYVKAEIPGKPGPNWLKISRQSLWTSFCQMLHTSQQF